MNIEESLDKTSKLFLIVSDEAEGWSTKNSGQESIIFGIMEEWKVKMNKSWLHLENSWVNG